ncbi:hypothetical protein E2C01_059092 [Portunus trituberculatus]|uniref:Uncharacterized protein n=1 Tax=Portunus trituberculatus TaxID=210409 RepID=A0A5B7H556_PORTR|nr:hypothetical protein [Portunus trituberculatus]
MDTGYSMDLKSYNVEDEIVMVRLLETSTAIPGSNEAIGYKGDHAAATTAPRLYCGRCLRRNLAYGYYNN